MRVCKITIYDEYGTAHEYLHNNAAPIQALKSASYEYDKNTGANYVNAAKIVIGFTYRDDLK